MKKACLIYNPTSGKELVKGQLGDIINAISEAGFDVIATPTTPEKLSAMHKATYYAKQGVDLIVVAGGDGTINEVINGIATLEKRPELAIIPGGTTNDYARALNIPRDDLVKAAQVIAKGNTLPMDIGRCNETYFINIAAGGFMTDLTYEVDSELKTKFGYVAYVMKALEKAFDMQSIHVKVEYDGGEYEGEAALFFVALTNSIGGLEKIIPDSHMTDGTFSFLLIKTTNILDIGKLFNQMLFTGKHIESDDVLYVKTRRLHITSLNGEKPVGINLDGEYAGDTPAAFMNLQQHVHIYANMDDTEVIEKNCAQLAQIDTQFKADLDAIQ